MADKDGSAPPETTTGEWAWKDDWEPPGSAAEDAFPKPVARSRPGAEKTAAQLRPTVRETEPKSRPWGALLIALGGAVLCLVWWAFWWEADHTVGTSLTQFAWPFLYLAAITCGYLFFVWRWIVRR